MWNTGYQYHLQLATGLQAIENYNFGIIFGFWKFMPLVIVSYVVGLSVEFAFAVNRKHQG